MIFLHHGEHAAEIKLDSDLNTVLARRRLFSGRTGNTANHGANHRAYGGSSAASARTTCDAANCPPCRRTDTGFGSFQLHRAYMFNYAHLHLVDTTGLGALVVVATAAAGTPGQHRGNQQ